MSKQEKEDSEGVKELKAFFQFLTKTELKIKEAGCFNKRIPYFRGDEFLAIIQENSADIKKLMPDTAKEYNFEDEDSRMKFLQTLLDHKALIALDRLPDEQKKYKYPKRLIWSRIQKASDKGFYFITIRSEGQQNRLKMYLVLSGIVLVCLFPIWPIKVKIAIFYICVFLLYLILGIIFGRLIVWAIFRIFGIDVWIMPCMFLEVPITEAFWPPLCVNRCHDGWKEYALRFLGSIVIAFVVFVIYHEPDILKAVGASGAQSFDDIIEWGKNKFDPNQTVVTIRGRKNVKNLDEIMNETKEEHEQRDKDNDDDDDDDITADEQKSASNDDYGDVKLARDEEI